MSKAQRWMQVAILSAMGAYFGYNLLTGNITNYIAQKFVWLTWIAAGLLLVLAAMSAALLLRRAAPDHNDHGDDEHEHEHHEHAHRRGLGAWIGLGIVALPVLFGFAVPSTPLDSRAVDGSVASDVGSIDAGPSQVIGTAPLDRNVLEWLRAFNTTSDLSTLNGQEADVIGFVYRDPELRGGERFLVARFVMSCCVADAQAIGLLVEWPDAAALRDDSWVRVRGTFEVKDVDGTTRPVLVAFADAEGVQPVEQPAHPYLYP